MHPLRVGAGTEQPVPVGIDLSLYCDGHHRGHLPLGRWERGSRRTPTGELRTDEPLSGMILHTIHWGNTGYHWVKLGWLDFVFSSLAAKGDMYGYVQKQFFFGKDGVLNFGHILIGQPHVNLGGLSH